MGKTVYSIVLSEDVIEVIDSMAVQQGLSRSGLINHVLAEYSGLSTHEHRVRQLTHTVRKLAAGGGLRGELSTGGTLTLHTALRYKYNPSLRYQLVLFENGALLGELRVSLRSQSEDLLGYMSTFFELWRRLELKYLNPPPGEDLAAYEPRRFRRGLRRPQGTLDEQQLGTAVSDYITAMDTCLKVFFQNLREPGAAVRETERAYKSALASMGPAKEL